jgi:hypothetical protein
MQFVVVVDFTLYSRIDIVYLAEIFNRDFLRVLSVVVRIVSMVQNSLSRVLGAPFDSHGLLAQCRLLYHLLLIQ